MSLENAVEELYSINEDIFEWSIKCDLAEAIRSINIAVGRLDSIGNNN